MTSRDASAVPGYLGRTASPVTVLWNRSSLPLDYGESVAVRTWAAPVRRIWVKVLMDQGAAAPIEDRAQVVEGPGDVDAEDVDVPVLVRLEGLVEAGRFVEGRRIQRSSRPAALSTRWTAVGADGDEVVGDHQEVRRR